MNNYINQFKEKEIYLQTPSDKILTQAEECFLSDLKRLDGDFKDVWGLSDDRRLHHLNNLNNTKNSYYKKEKILLGLGVAVFALSVFFSSPH